MDEKKIEILEKSTQIFLKYGIKSVTMEDLARELGMSKKTLYTFFKDKNDIVVHIIQAKTQLDQLACSAVKNQVGNAIEEMLGINTHVTSMMKNIHPTVFYDLKRYHPDAFSVMQKHKWSFVKEMIMSNIKRGIKEGIYRKELDVELIAMLYVGTTDLISEGDVFFDYDKSSDQIFETICMQHLHSIVNIKGRKILNQILIKENE